MIRNYFRIALRNIERSKLFAFINIGGMAISVTSCLLIGLFVWDEQSYDRHLPDADRTFRVYNVRHGTDGITNYFPIVPYPFATYMQKDFPEIESTLRILDTYGDRLFTVGENRILESHGIYAEPAVFDMLALQMLEGKNELDQPATVALSQSLARKYFPATAVGEIVRIGETDFRVAAVYADPPEHLHLQANFILSFATVTRNFSPQRFENWVNQQYFIYLKLKPGTNAAALEAKFLPFVEKYAYPKTKPEGFTYEPHLQAVTDIHLGSSSFEWEIAQRGSGTAVGILTVTAVFLLVITVLNFVNLSTARAMKRMKEVGVRKVVGAARRQLITQFLSESILITIAGLLCAVVAVELLLPSLNSFAEKHLAIPYGVPFYAGLLVAGLLLAVAAGGYPALYLSSFRPAMALHTRDSIKGVSWLRQTLVVIQFMFSFFLIAGSLIVISQNDLLRNKSLGFNKEHLVTIQLRSAQLRQQESTKQEFMKVPEVVSASICFGLPGDIVAGDGVTDPETNRNLPANLFCIDYDYIRTLGMEMVAGRAFNPANANDVQGFILNETAVRTYGFGTPEEAIGHPLHWQVWGSDSVKKGTVIGVVRDFHFKSLRDQMTPAVLQIAPDYAFKIALRLKGDHLAETVAGLRSTYQRLDPDYPFTYKFIDENFDAMYKSESKLTSLFSIFTGIAIAVACFGLFGLVEYSVNQRVREISIRKVFGADIQSLLVLLTGRYFILLSIAFVVIIPVSYYAAQDWLNSFAFHVTVSPWIYVKAGALILSITILTVCFQSLKAAYTNPARVLRRE